MSHCADILVGVFDGDCAARTLAYATDAARERNARVTLLTVVPHMLPVLWPIALPYERQAIVEASERALRLASARIPRDVPVTLEVAHGGVGKQILRRAASGGHGLIVLGPEHCRVLLRRVVKHAAVPVVIVDW